MQFKPCSEQELADRKLWAKGVYPFEIIEAEEKRSKAGKTMIELHVTITDRNGQARTVRDYLLGEMPDHLRNCCIACGLLDKYETGVLSHDDFVGKRGRLQLTIEKAKKNSGWPDRNVIAEYLVSTLPPMAA